MSETIRIAIGSEPLQRIAADVLKHSILRRTERPVQFVESWTIDGWHPILKEIPKLPRGTRFNTFRWCLPGLFGQGKAIYLDSDQIVLSDIGELWDSLPDGATIACVCNAVGVFGKRQPEPGKPQTSVMVADVGRMSALMAKYARGHNDRGPVQDCAAGGLVYADLMQGAWIPWGQIAELPPEWNHFNLKYENTKLLHFSKVSDQAWRCPDHPSAEAWYSELRETVEAGIITTTDLESEVGRGHLHGVFLKRIRRDAA